MSAARDPQVAAAPVAPDSPAMAQAFTGKLMKGQGDGEVRGWLYDHRSGVRIEFSGVRDPRRGGGYLLVGRRVPV